MWLRSPGFSYCHPPGLCQSQKPFDCVTASPYLGGWCWSQTGQRSRSRHEEALLCCPWTKNGVPSKRISHTTNAWTTLLLARTHVCVVCISAHTSLSRKQTSAPIPAPTLLPQEESQAFWQQRWGEAHTSSISHLPIPRAEVVRSLTQMTLGRPGLGSEQPPPGALIHP